MKSKLIKHLRNAFFTILILLAAFGVSILLQDVFNISEHITTLFAFAVFLISLMSDGYVYGIVSAFVGVLAINYAFTYPYFNVDFSAPTSIISAVVMLIISFLTSAFTTKLKKWQSIKSESEKERMRANLLRSVSHDLRTPLTTIYGASTSIIDNFDKLTKQQTLQMVCGIKEDSEWLIRIVENLLSITKIDGGRVKLLKSPTVLDELIDSVILKFKKRYPAQEVTLELPDTLVMIPMDALLIEQVIINILENTVHHATGFTQLTLRVFLKDNCAVFEICDNGCGIAKEKLDTIFTGCADISDGNVDTQKRNAGIGLSVCATIIRAHGGEIYAENSKNGGAVLRFCMETEEESHEQ